MGTNLYIVHSAPYIKKKKLENHIKHLYFHVILKELDSKGLKMVYLFTSWVQTHIINFNALHIKIKRIISNFYFFHLDAERTSFKRRENGTVVHYMVRTYIYFLSTPCIKKKKKIKGIISSFFFLVDVKRT